VQARGPGAKRNFPGEVISELPVSLGERRKQLTSSRYIGVSWNRVGPSWRAQLWEPQTKLKRHIGCYTSEDDAARAYDFAAVTAHGPGATRNFPGEVVSELPLTVGEVRKERSSSLFVGVCWSRAHSSWQAFQTDPQTNRKRHIGCFKSEEDASRAYQGVRQFGCASTRTRRQAQLPVRGHKRAACDSWRGVVAAHQLALHRRNLGQAQLFMGRAAEGPTVQAPTAHCLRGGRGQGVRLCSCAGARTRRQAQLPGQAA
jgi:hypothetical protein